MRWTSASEKRTSTLLAYIEGEQREERAFANAKFAGAGLQGLKLSTNESNGEIMGKIRERVKRLLKFPL
jgi:hypothetical protein